MNTHLIWINRSWFKNVINITLEVVPLQKRSKTFSVFIPRIVLTNHCCTKSFHILIQI